MEQAEEQECGRPLPHKDTPVAFACHEECGGDENRAECSPIPDLRWGLIGDAEVVVLCISCLIRSCVNLCQCALLSRELHFRCLIRSRQSYSRRHWPFRYKR